ncbi:hypothetical protein KFL_004530070 [Klebsormidium nitens]|uniref:Protein kinase domain-containing protein n=1 Tax=Klebsormidium nitens TaxID=105231 RepID=A0A1Y1IDP4_KLENI|nr:hypothetical protein KFL_004530070 [Klebsormidium nitens]|eukprot:GAQ88703.1 hypothetical protein KFL_004530070 [Klebsormidium nitens]
MEDYDMPQNQEGRDVGTTETVYGEWTRKLHGWRRNQPLPEYAGLLDKMTEYFKRHAFAPNNELEVRLGKVHEKPRRFEPGVSANMFHKILEGLRSYQSWEDETVTRHTDYLTGERRLRVYEDPGMPPELVAKRSLVSLDVVSMGSPFDFRFSIAKEKVVEATEQDITSITANAKHIRHKERMTFAYKAWLFDLTIVRSQSGASSVPTDDCFDDTSEERNGGRVYEVEIELRNLATKVKKTAFNAMRLADSTLIKLFDLMNFVEEIQREVDLLKIIRCTSVVELFDAWFDPERNEFHIATELFLSGSLKDYLKRHGHIALPVVKRWTRDLLEGLVYLHEQEPPIVHRDVKCDNIFIRGDVGQVKLGDLGLSTLKNRSSMSSVVGTPEFMAEEMFNSEYDKRVDCYSLGMCVLEMTTLEYPFAECKNIAQVYRKVMERKPPDSLQRIKEPELKTFITRCLARRSIRPTAKELLSDPLLSDCNDPSPLLAEHKAILIRVEPIDTTAPKIPRLLSCCF